MDKGHKQADRDLKKMEKRLKKEYDKAYTEMRSKTDAWLAKFRERDLVMYNKLEDGLISYDEYIQWRKHNMLTTTQMQGICTELSQTLYDYNTATAGMINAHARTVFCNNFNYGAFEICKGTNMNIAFTLVDEKTVDRLLKGNIKLLPHVDIDEKKDKRWNMQKVQAALTQGILQGDSVPNIAKRLKQVTNMSDSAAVRNARTMTTSAENGGRMAVYEEAEKMGIELQKTWVATLDERTRDSHIELDGVTIPIDQKFENSDGELMYPADPNGDAANVYNCRCTLITTIKNHGRDLTTRQMGERLGNMSYEEWKNEAAARIEARKK